MQCPQELSLMLSAHPLLLHSPATHLSCSHSPETPENRLASAWEEGDSRQWLVSAAFAMYCGRAKRSYSLSQLFLVCCFEPRSYYVYLPDLKLFYSLD